jgi:hypothetical protein
MCEQGFPALDHGNLRNIPQRRGGGRPAGCQLDGVLEGAQQPVTTLRGDDEGGDIGATERVMIAKGTLL